MKITFLFSILLIVLFQNSCSSIGETLKEENPKLYQEVVGVWTVIEIKNGKVKKGDEITFEESGIFHSNTGKEYLCLEGESIERWEIEETINSIIIVCATRITRSSMGTGSTVSSSAGNTAYYPYKYKINIENVSDANIKQLKKVTVAPDSKNRKNFYYIKDASKEIIDLAIKSLQKDTEGDYKEKNKIYFEDLETIKSLEPNLMNVSINENDTEIQKEEKINKQSKFISAHLKKIIGKQITLNSVKMKNIEQEEVLTEKGIRMQEERSRQFKKNLAIAGADAALKMGYADMMSEDCTGCSIKTNKYFATFNIESPIQEEMSDNEYYYQGYPIHILLICSKKDALEFNKDNIYKLKYKIKNVEYDEDKNAGKVRRIILIK